MAEFYENLRALELELKIRELHQRERWEARKLGAFLARLIITNLILMNGAAASSVPVIASFMGIAALPWRDKQVLLFWPSAAFAFGLTCALLCAIGSYFTFMRTSAGAFRASDAEIAAFRAAYAYRPSLALDPGEAKAIVKDGDWAFAASQALGWLSLVSLLTGWFWILQIEAPPAPLR